MHSHLTQSELNGYNDAINTASFLRRGGDARNKKAREHNLKELGNFDFGYVEKGDETITSGNHYHQKNDRDV